MSKAKISKGSLVRLNITKCFTVKQGGLLRFPLTNHYHDEEGLVQTYRPTTAKEQQAWYNSRASKGINSAGESPLAPQGTPMMLHRDRVYVVLRARAAVCLGWGNKTGGLTKVFCSVTGQETYVKRELIEPFVVKARKSLHLSVCN